MMHLSLLRGRVMWVALLAALAIGMSVVLGGVGGGGVYGQEANVAPEFPGTLDTDLEIPENTPPGVNIGDPISAIDADETGEAALEFGDTLTYSLGGPDAASFDIDASTGQLITKAPLDIEAKFSYSVTVMVEDGETRDPAISQSVTITVTNVTEPPLAPFRPTVVSGEYDDTSPDTNESSTSLKVVWHPPENIGRPAISSYAVEYKKSTGNIFFSDDNPDTTATEVVTITDITRTATIMGLEVDTSYQVRVRATNEDRPGSWSLVGTGSTNKAINKPPDSNEVDAPAVRDVNENTAAGEDVGIPVTATDPDTTTLTYRLEGPDAHMFNFDTRSGQIRTKSPLNHENAECAHAENTCTYRVTVVVSDGAGGTDATGVNITVDNVTEPASAPARPTVRATEKSSTSLDVSWIEPVNTGPPITSYTVQYRASGDDFSDDNCDTTGADNCRNLSGTKVTITDLEDDTTYEVRVLATNSERASDWSTSGSGRTSRANHQPIFDVRPHTGDGSGRGTPYTTSLVINENSQSGQSVGRLFADDEDNDTLTYKLSGTDEDKFEINTSTGQIRTKVGVDYNYEGITADDTCAPLTDAIEVGSDKCYTVTVEVRDGLDDDRVEEEETEADDSITLKIGVRDRLEPPSAPTVTVTSPATITTLIVIWEAQNTGPNITSYDLQYRKGSGSFSADNCGTESPNNCMELTAITTVNIVALDEDTSYSVQVRAKNDEGTSDWSRLETLKTNKENNALPTFTDASPTTRAVGENIARNQNIGAPVSASDDETTSLTYTLEGRDAALFSITRTNGQIKTKSPLNHEDPGCGYDAEATETVCTYSVMVKVDDKTGGSASIAVSITVNDVDERPTAPTAPRVTATKDTGWSLDVTWNEPSNTGKPPITDYDIQYREFKSGTEKDAWDLWPHGTAADSTEDNTDRQAKIERRLPADNADPLKPSTPYEVRVRAKNGEGDTNANWSSVARGTTGKSNSRPIFDISEAVTLSVNENTRAGQNVGSAVSASDADSNTLRYSLAGSGKDSFTIVSSTGQIKTKAALDYETRASYSVTVKVDDGQKRANSVAAKSVTITVDDVYEQPPAPAAPTVSGIPRSTDSVRVTWAAPANTGVPVIGYDVHYREVGKGPARWTHFGVDSSTIITGLKAGTRYEVQVRARSIEDIGEWSSWGAGSPNPDAANRFPAFSGSSRTLSVAENTPSNSNIGAPVAATDRDSDTLTYTLEGTDAASFDILSTSDGGQIRTSAALNYEEKSSYSVTVRVTDGRGGTDAVNVTIRVTDVNGEAPDTPFAPTVAAVSSTSLQVNWEVPGNTGPPIIDYDYRYREGSGTWTQVTNTTITGRTATITGLTASTSYDVEVRATNAEGTSEWSDPGIGSTNAAGANNRPVFSDGASATRSVSARSAAGTSVGLPLEATDADPSDTLTYSLGGRDAPFFDIRSTTGQLSIKSGVTLIAGDTYTVTVSASDDTDTAQIAVSIEALAAPPNNPPVFSEGASATRSVARNAAAGTSIGNPVRATDADTGESVTYSLGGADAGSFEIVGTSGQLRTKAGVTLMEKDYSVRVTATDPHNAIANIAVTITATDSLGAVTLTPSRPSVGDTVTARVTDPDGGLAGVTWQWATSPNGTSNWLIILGASGNSYATTALTEGRYLRATASYGDTGGTGKSAVAVTSAAVRADDDGSVSLSTSSPEVGETVTATLSDPDTVTSGSVTWQWARSSNGSTWTNILVEATSATYTPRASDEGSYLRATASYDDSVGDGKSAEAATSSRVAPPDLIVSYDSNGNGTIERSEAAEAVRDYFNDEITKDELITVLTLYFAG